MATTTNLEVTLLTATQSAKYASVNTGFSDLDAALAAILSKEVAGTGTTTLSSAEALRHLVFDFTSSGALGAGEDIEVPNNPKLYIARDSTTGGQTVTLKVAGQTGVVLTSGYQILYCDGTDVREVGGGGGGISTIAAATDTNISGPASGEMLRWDGADWVNEAVPYDVGAGANGTFTSSQVVLRYVFARAATLPTDTVEAFLGTAATDATATFTVKKNGSSIGTFAFNTSSQTPDTVSITGTAFAAGDRLTVEAPSSVDTTAADIHVTFPLTRD